MTILIRGGTVVNHDHSRRAAAGPARDVFELDQAQLAKGDDH